MFNELFTNHHHPVKVRDLGHVVLAENYDRTCGVQASPTCTSCHLNVFTCTRLNAQVIVTQPKLTGKDIIYS